MCGSSYKPPKATTPPPAPGGPEKGADQLVFNNGSGRSLAQQISDLGKLQSSYANFVAPKPGVSPLDALQQQYNDLLAQQQAHAVLTSTTSSNLGAGSNGSAGPAGWRGQTSETAPFLATQVANSGSASSANVTNANRH